jgi:hypothetical protein
MSDKQSGWFYRRQAHKVKASMNSRVVCVTKPAVLNQVSIFEHRGRCWRERAGSSGRLKPADDLRWALE